MVETSTFSSGQLIGIPAAPGMAEGQAVFLETLDVQVPRSNGHDPSVEFERLQNARAKARAEMSDLKEKVALAVQSGEADIFDAHMMFLDDVVLLKKAEKSIESTFNAEASWMDAVESFAVQLEALPDPTLKARAVDIRDVGRRVLCHLLGIPVDDLHMEGPAVVIASDLTPSQTAGLEKGKILAFCMEKGGPTSHTAILAKALGIPAVVGLGPRILTVKPGSGVLVDGALGQVIINPDEQTATAFRKSTDQSKRRKLEALAAASQPAVTLDGFHAEIVANIGSLQDAETALANHAEGVGLFRTEFLFLNRTDLPGEAEQVQIYKQVFDRMGDLPIVVRTLDIGGDKAVSYINFEEEANPFLGWRAIRMNEGRPDIFSSQVRALLQAGVGKDLRIMMPMVSNLEEITLARQLLDDAREYLREEGIPNANQVQFGIMVEIPSAALIADRLAPYLDFFSIGTNDLTQYTLAADRTNARVAHLASPYHPAVLRLIQMTIQAAHDHDKWVGVCGEMAGEVIATPLLLGLGLDEFSMAPTMVPSIKQTVRKCAKSDCQRIAEKALTLTSIYEVIDLLTLEATRLDLL
jgi:phosphoenolpyruvate-protein phosphotransferase